MNPLLALWQRVLSDPPAPAVRRRAAAQVPIRPQASSSTVFLVLRRMRAPLIALILVYAATVLGLTLIPGVDPEGRPWRMSLFHAFYFMSYTATTIGFGEIPYPFSDAQRLWVTFSIYLTVIGWAYVIGMLFAILQDRAFRQSLALQRFTRRVRVLGEPFVLVTGAGQTGRRLVRSLDRLGRRAVVVDINGDRIDTLALADLRADVPSLAADARDAGVLAVAGLANPHCEAIIALTDDDEANLSVVMTAALLRPDLPVIARTASHAYADRMKTFGSPAIVDPFDLFGDYLRLAVRAPSSFHLIEWLTGTPGDKRPPRREPPRGRWIVCGYGRFGAEVTADLRAEGLEVTVVEPGAPAAGDPSIIIGYGTEPAVFARAQPETAVGLIAATDNDIANLSIVAAARRANPGLFLIARQSEPANKALFRSLGVDFALIPSQVVAHEVLARITSPLTYRFLAAVATAGNDWADATLARLAARSGDTVPALRRFRLVDRDAGAIVEWLSAGRPVALGDLLRDPRHRENPLPLTVLMVARGAQNVLAPGDEFELRPGDEFLVAGRPWAGRALASTLYSPRTRDYVLLGREAPGGWLWSKLFGPAPDGAAPSAR